MGNLTMKSFGLIGLITIGLSAPVAAQETFDLTLQATGPFNPPTGTGSFTIDAPPPGTNLTGLFFQGPPGSGSPGNELTEMSFDFGGVIFDFSSELTPSATVQFNSSGKLTSIGYLGRDSSGDALSFNGLDYQLFGPNFASVGTVTSATPITEPASMALITVALAGMAAVRRRRHT